MRVAAVNYAAAFKHEAKKQLDVAAAMYRISADLGHADACCALGNLYAYGKGVAADQKTALEWYEKAHSFGCAEATLAIGNRFWYGTHGATFEPQRALDFYAVMCDPAYPADEAKKVTSWKWSEMKLEHARGTWLLSAGTTSDPHKGLDLLDALFPGRPVTDALTTRLQYARAGMLLSVDGRHSSVMAIAVLGDAVSSAGAAIAALAAGTPPLPGATGGRKHEAENAKPLAALCVFTGALLPPGSSTLTKDYLHQFRRCNAASGVEAFLDRALASQIPPPIVKLITAFACDAKAHTFIEAHEYVELADRLNHRMADRVVLLRRAATLGSSHAQANLGAILHSGYGAVVADLEAALPWHLAALAQGVAQAGHNAGVAFLDTKPQVSGNIRSAFACFNRGSALGSADCMYRLAMLLDRNHEGFPRDPLRVLSLVRAAAANSECVIAQSCLSHMLEVGYGLDAVDLQGASRLHYATLDKYDKLRGGEQSGGGGGAHNAGEFVLLYGIGRIPDEETPVAQRAIDAIALWRLGAATGESNCCYRLGWAHATGTLGCELDALLALDWFSRAAETGHAAAASHLAVLKSTPDVPCLFRAYDYEASRGDFLELARLVGLHRSQAAARSGVNILCGLSFVWRDIEARLASGPVAIGASAR